MLPEMERVRSLSIPARILIASTKWIDPNLGHRSSSYACLQYATTCSVEVRSERNKLRNLAHLNRPATPAARRRRTISYHPSNANVSRREVRAVMTFRRGVTLLNIGEQGHLQLSDQRVTQKHHSSITDDSAQETRAHEDKDPFPRATNQ